MVRVLGWFLVGGGIVAVLFPVVTWNRVRASRRWPHVQGRIIESRLDRESRSGKGGYTYAPRIRYSYVVDGREHESSQINFWGVVGGSQGVAERTTRRYPEGAGVAVYYNPQDSHEAVLDRAFSPLVFILPPVGLFLIAAGYVLLQR
jgi:hypothetical protein